MRTVKISEDFTGYPSGKKRDFTKGETVEVPADFADLIVEKGHAKEVAASEEKPARRKTEAERP